MSRKVHWLFYLDESELTDPNLTTVCHRPLAGLNTSPFKNEVTCENCRPELRRVHWEHTLGGKLDYLWALPTVESVSVVRTEKMYYLRTTIAVTFKAHTVTPSCASPTSDLNDVPKTLYLHPYSTNEGRTYRWGDDDLHKIKWGHSSPRFANGGHISAGVASIRGIPHCDA